MRSASIWAKRPLRTSSVKPRLFQRPFCACSRPAKSAGLPAIEAYHSDHGPGDTRHYLAEANHYGFGVTGGSDFHGDAKPGVMLGRGLNGNLSVPISVLEDLRALSRSLHHS
jgi:hypothetical protein